MKILHLSCVAPPEHGGIGAVAYQEVVGLRARGMDARLVAPYPATNGVLERSFVDYIEPRLRIGNGAILPHLMERARGADLIHLHYPFFGVAEPLLLHAASLPPIVVTFHMDASTKGWKGAVVRLERFALQSSLLRQAKRILVSSFDYASHSSLKGLMQRDPELVRELPFGIDTDFFCPGPREAARFGLPDDARVLLAVGVMDEAHAFKGISVLLKSLVAVEESVHLLLVGDGPLRSTYETQAQALGLRKRVHFLGRVDLETLRSAYRTADVTVMPSTDGAEAFGLVGIESLACGTPVIASNLPGVRTVVRHMETGLLVPPRDEEALTAAIKQLMEQTALRQTMKERARTGAVSTFSWQRHLDGLQEIYQSVWNASRS
ncbi:MAG: glycosyltransferase family 4 protein [bacterium]|nr:glycosyltransferase family 4 protein [bacterium]